MGILYVLWDMLAGFMQDGRQQKEQETSPYYIAFYYLRAK